MKFSLKIATIGLAIAFLPINSGISQEVTSSLEGLEYTKLPPQLCLGTSANLIGKLKNEQYGSVICERKSGSYIFIQKLIGYSDTGESIWQIKSLKKLPKLRKLEFVIQLGCHHLEIKNAVIFAIVKQVRPGELLALKAWKVNLSKEKLERVSARKVVCFTPSFW